MGLSYDGASRAQKTETVRCAGVHDPKQIAATSRICASEAKFFSNKRGTLFGCARPGAAAPTSFW